uniref:Ribonuclease VapC n=1 Tax=uncultured Thiotrichaceae bacterium TaxID=298394 RepID=A0A6S6UM01_9GAMM|nr:MAG: VapC toxin protein [uncultured Thiotrichaceae bacterium]
MSARYMLDTDTCIYLKNRRPPAIAERFSKLQWGEVVMSLVTYGELYNGAKKSREASAALENIELLGKRVPVQPMNKEVAETYGVIRSELEKQGNTIGGNDLWIAAHALTLGLTLVTNNTREFQRIPKLKVENWV